MHIDCVIVSVGFGDYLWDSLPRNLALVDDVVVVTSKGDMQTVAACVRWGVRCHRTEEHLSGQRKFDKGRALNAGLALLGRRDWILALDADIVLPPDARRHIDRAGLDCRCIYGVDRVDCMAWTQYAAWLTGQAGEAESGVWIGPPTGMHNARRFVDPARGGWFPAGYFHLWHSCQWDDYAWAPGSDADYHDVVHAARWPRERRHLLPDWYALHLMAGPRTLGADWTGRTTRTWGPPPVAEVLARAGVGPVASVQVEAGSGRPADAGPNCVQIG